MRSELTTGRGRQRVASEAAAGQAPSDAPAPRQISPDDTTARAGSGRGFPRVTQPSPVLPGAATVGVLVAIYAAFGYAPTEAEMGPVQRIFYFHVASAWVAFLAFLVVFGAGVLYLRRRDAGLDYLAEASAELGVIFCSLALVTGSLWAKPIWGAWWTWDPRLTTTLVLWLIYLSYLMIRKMIEEPGRRARFAAVFGIVGFADVPIVFMSIRWWRTMHPVVFSPGDVGLAPQMLVALLVAVGAFTLLYAYLLRLRVAVGRADAELAALRERLYYSD